MKNLREEIDNTLRLSGMFSGGKLYEDKNGNPRFEGEDIKEMLLDKLLSLFKQQMKGLVPEKRIELPNSLTGFNPSIKALGFNEAIDQLLKNIEGL